MPTITKRTSKISGKISYQAKVRIRGYKSVSATFDRKTDANKWAQRTEAEMHEGKYFPSNKARKNTVSDLIDAYLTNLKVRNPRRYGEVQPLLTWWKNEIGHIVLFHFTGQDISNCQKKLVTKKTRSKAADGQQCTLSPATVNRYTAALHTAINYGIKPLKWIVVNPVNDLDKLKEPPGRTRYLHEDEIKRLLDACRQSSSQHLFALVVLGIATGARRKELQCIKWSDVDNHATRVTLHKTKNGEVRTIYLTGLATQIVQKMREQKKPGQVYLFPSPNDLQKPVNFESSWQHALKVAGINDFRFHDLRHTCGSYLAMNGASAVEIAEVLGHKTLQMARRYAHLSDTHTSNVISKMTQKVLSHVEI